MIILMIFLIILFFIFSAFFSGIETGLISIDRLKLEQEARTDNKKKSIQSFLEKPDQLFGTTLFGTNISIVIVTSLTVIVVHHFQKIFEFDISEHYISLIIAIMILIFAEIIPKALYREKPNKLVTKYFPLLRFFSILLTPFVKFVSGLNSLLAKVFRLPKTNKYSLLTREDISLILSETQDDENLQQNQREMLEDALEFTELQAENVMIHRTDIVALEENTPFCDIVDIARKEGYTRFPVYRDDLDNIIGIMIIYDVMKKEDPSKLVAKDLVREAFFAPETMDVDTLLTEMQSSKKSMAIIVDSFGGTAGLLTIEDILEEIVGEIEDEYDTNTSTVDVKKISDSEYEIMGFVEIDFLNDEHNLDLPEGDYETIAGLIIDNIARIPTSKTKVKIGKWDIIADQVTNRKIERVRLVEHTLEKEI